MITLTQPKIASDIYELHEHRHDEQEPRDYLGGSALGRKCIRQIWYDFRKADLPQFEGRLLRLFETGHREEDRMVEELQAAGYEVHGTNPNTGDQFEVTAFGGHMEGHFDGLLRGVPDAPKKWHLLETKTSNTKGFDKLEDPENGGVRKVKWVHYAQMQVYMGLAPKFWDAWGLDGEPPTSALYMVHCKEDERLYLERVHFDEAVFFDLGVKAKTIIEATAPPERISFEPEYYLCRWCDYSGICHGGDVPRFDCRTCINSTPDQDRETWWCERVGGPLGVDGDYGGCPEHLYIPPLLQSRFGDVVDYDRDGYEDGSGCDWIEYENGEGVRIKNAVMSLSDDGTPSQEIYKKGAQ